MTDPAPRRPKGSGGEKTSKSEKERLERQAAALRENLRRRNAQRRGRATEDTDSEGQGGDS